MPKSRVTSTSRLGCGLAVGQLFLVQEIVGSNPTTPATTTNIVPSGVNRNLSGEKPNLCRVRTQLFKFLAVFVPIERSRTLVGSFQEMPPEEPSGS